MVRKLLLLPSMVLSVYCTMAQQPRYTEKHFVTTEGEKEFTPVIPEKDGAVKTYITASVGFLDIDDAHSTFIRFGKKVLLCVEGQYKAHKREGVFYFYAIDSLDHTKRYKVYEQTFSGDKLNGEWRTYSLAGTLASVQHFKNDSLRGITRHFWIDGKSVVEETEYLSSSTNYILREYSRPDSLERETTFVNNKPNGRTRVFYPTGIVKDEIDLKDGTPNGIRRYHYPSGSIWSEVEVKDGKPWTAIANYTPDGKKRDPGTLKNGTGTLKLYDDDGSVRETLRFIEGVQIH